MPSSRAKAILVCGIFAVVALTAAAAPSEEEFSFVASVDKVSLGVDESLTLTVSVSGTGIGAVGEPELPALNDFEIVGRSSSQSSQFSIVNGKVSSTKTISYLYTLKPRKTGELTIGSAEVSYKKKVYRTDPVKIFVTAGSRSQQQVPQEPAPSPSGKDISLDARVDKTTAFVGEQITIEYALSVAVGLSNVRLASIPSYPGFWSEEVFSARSLDFKTKVLGGKRYDVAPIKTVALFPTTAGRFEIEPMSITCDIAERSGDLFRDFWGRTKTVTVRSDPASVEVKPLPARDRPSGFSGAVGSFSFGVKVPSRTVNAGEPAEVVVEVSGEGNIRTVEVPKFTDVPGFKVYEPEVSLDLSNSGNRIRGVKTYKYMIVPDSEGKHVIPPLSFSFFNPKDGRYRTITTEEITLEAKGVAGSLLTSPAGRAPVKLLGRDILYIKPDLKRMRLGGGRLYANPAFLIFQILPAVVLFAAFVYQRHRQRVEVDAAYARSRRAKPLASARLKRARTLLARRAFSSVPSEVSKALIEYVGDKTNSRTAGQTLEVVLDRLEERGASPDALDTLRRCIERCDYMRFAVSDLDEVSALQVIELADSFIDRLERERSARTFLP